MSLKAGVGRDDPLQQIGVIHVAGDVTDSIRIGTHVGGNLAGRVEIGGNLTGDVEVLYRPTGQGGGELSGVIHVGSLSSDFSGTIGIDRNIVGGTIQIDGARMTGLIEVFGGISAGGVRINSDFGQSNPDLAASVYIHGSIGNRGYVTTDWDAHEWSYTWLGGSTVTVGNQTYYAPEYSARIFQPVPCRGDMNGDLHRNFADIDGFVAAIPGAPPEHVEAVVPGFGGSAWFHADADGSGYVNFGDIDPFVALIPSCCPPGDGQVQGGGQEELELFGLPGDGAALGSAIFDAIDNAASPAGAAYWEGVFYNGGDQ